MMLIVLTLSHAHLPQLSKDNVFLVDDASREWRSVYLAVIDNGCGRPKHQHRRYPLICEDVTKQDNARVEDLDILMKTMTLSEAPRKVKQTIRAKGEGSLAQACGRKVRAACSRLGNRRHRC